MPVVDATTLLLFLEPDAPAPLDPATDEPVTDAKARIDHLIEALDSLVSRCERALPPDCGVVGVLRGGTDADPEPPEPVPPPRSKAETLPITLDPPSPDAFRDALLRERRAWIVEIHRDGRKVGRLWDARNMSLSSNVIGNLRSRPRYRRNAWKRLGIQSLVVSIERP